MKPDKIHLINIALICIFGLTPLLWFPLGHIQAGHDSGLAFNNLIHFLDRFWVWTLRYGIGSDQSFALGGFFIHGFEAFVSAFGFSLSLTQKITFVVWFTLPGLAMYLLGNIISSDRKYRSGWLIASFMYMFNHFLLQAWFVAERTKFSIYIALPLIIAIFICLDRKQIKPLTAALLSALILFLLNGGGFLPLYGTLIITWFAVSLFYIYINKGWETFKRIALFSVLTVIFFLLLNSYWFIPYAYNTTHVYATTVESIGGIEGLKSWINSISQNATYDNLLRLQGIQEWYVNKYHPYASNFLENPFLIFLSFLLPVGAFGVLFIKSALRKYIVLFALIGVFSMIMAAGSQPPFGMFYIFLIENVPGFAIFRTPFYKFATSLWLSYSILIGILINHLFYRYFYERNKIVQYYLSVTLTLMLIIFYSYPFLTGSFLDYVKGYYTMRIKPPQYVEDFGQSINNYLTKTDRVILFPENSANLMVESYKWKYWSLAPLFSLLTDISFVGNNSLLNEKERYFMDVLYKNILKNNEAWLKIAGMFSINHGLVRYDFDWNQKNYETHRPEEYEAILNSSGNIRKILEKGEWRLYKFNDIDNDFFYSSNEIHLTNVSYKDISQLIELPKTSSTSAFIFNGDLKNSEEVIKRINSNFIKNLIIPTCVTCGDSIKTLSLPEVDLFGVGSRFYWFRNMREERQYSQLVDPNAKFKFTKEKMYRRIAGLRKLYVEERSIEDKLEGINETEKQIDRILSIISNPGVRDEIEFYRSLIEFRYELEQIIPLVEGINIYVVEQNIDVEFQQLDKLLNKINHLYDTVSKLSWRDDEINKKYIFSVTDKGQYNLLLDQEVTASVSGILNDVEAIIDDINSYVNTTRSTDPYQIDGVSNRIRKLYSTINVLSLNAAELNKKYLFKIPSANYYKLLLDKNTVVSSRQIINNNLLKIQLDGEEIIIPVKMSDNSKWIETDNIFLTKGLHRLLFVDTKPFNLLSEQLDKLKFKNVTKEGNIFRINSSKKGEIQCMRIPLPTPDIGSTYRFEFDYKKEKGEQDLIVYITSFKDTENFIPINGVEGLSLSDTKRHYVKQIIPTKDDNILNICNRPNKRSRTESINQVSNISYSKILFPYFVFVNEAETKSSNNSTIEVNQINNTTYQIRTNFDTNKLVVFSQRYSPDWIIRKDDKDDSLIKKVLTNPRSDSSITQIQVNDVLNGWIIPAGNSSYIVEYYPQRIFYRGIGITLLTLVVVISILLYKRKKW